MKPYENPARLFWYLELRRGSLNPFSDLESDLRRLDNRELVTELYQACVRMQKLLRSTNPVFVAPQLGEEAHYTLLYLEELQREIRNHALLTSSLKLVRETLIHQLASLIIDMMEHILTYRERVALVRLGGNEKPDSLHLLKQGLCEIPDLHKNFPTNTRSTR